MQLTVEQRVFVVTKYLETKSIDAVKTAFRLQFPNRVPPTHKAIYDNVAKYKRNGTSKNLNKGNSGRRRFVRSPENIQAVRDLLNNNPTVSIRRNQLELSRSTFSRVVKHDLKWHPYKIHVRHQLKPTDFEKRFTFCRWFLGQCHNVRFLHNFVIGDEASFAMNGKVNTQNVRFYAPAGEAPNFNFDVNQARQKLSVWAGLCGNGTLLGPFFFDGNVNGQKYLEMFNTSMVPGILRNYNLMHENFVYPAGIWWAQDGAPPHIANPVRARLRAVFGEKVVSRGHQTLWPARSPDLTPCDHFLWGYIKSKVYITPPADLQELRRRIDDSFIELRGNQNMIRSVFREMRRRAQLCIDNNGRHVEGVH